MKCMIVTAIITQNDWLFIYYDMRRIIRKNGCELFEPTKCEKESSPSDLKYYKKEPVKLMLDKSRSIDKPALTIQNCEKIILKPKSLEVEVKIEKDNFGDFDYIVINGIKFKREK